MTTRILVIDDGSEDLNTIVQQLRAQHPDATVERHEGMKGYSAAPVVVGLMDSRRLHSVIGGLDTVMLSRLGGEVNLREDLEFCRSYQDDLIRILAVPEIKTCEDLSVALPPLDPRCKRTYFPNRVIQRRPPKSHKRSMRRS